MALIADGGFIKQADKKNLLDYLSSQGSKDPQKDMEQILSEDSGFVDRFNYFLPFLEKKHYGRLLITGCANGGEMIVANNYGFLKIFGADVSKKYTDISKIRTASSKKFQVNLYNGEALPYKNNYFDTVCSGHVIEHTPSPFIYFKDCFKVLKPGGIFFIEFPQRYNKTELHTETFSFERLPGITRIIALKMAAIFDKKNSLKYNSIAKDLSPVSIWQIRMYLKLCPTGGKVMDIQKPHPGYVRMVLRKNKD